MAHTQRYQIWRQELCFCKKNLTLACVGNTTFKYYYYVLFFCLNLNFFIANTRTRF